MNKCQNCGELCSNCHLSTMTLRELLGVAFFLLVVPTLVIYYGGSIINERNYLRQQVSDYEALLQGRTTDCR